MVLQKGPQYIMIVVVVALVAISFAILVCR